MADFRIFLGNISLYKGMMRVASITVGVLLLLPGVVTAAANEIADADPLAPPQADIINRYLQATQSQGGAVQNASMEVDIRASVPKLKQNGTLHALRQISKVGKITYRVVAFQGSNTVKNQVIARFLQADQQGQGDQKLAITPENYKFKFKGRKVLENGRDVFAFQVAPRHKKVGLFKGEVWLDTRAYLPVYEKGRLVKNPSIFFKRVNFERAFAIENGQAIPEHMSSTIDTRIVGRVELNVNYSKVAVGEESSSIEDEANLYAASPAR
jgi:hypothetical protein